MISGSVGWRAAFVLVAVLAAASAAWVWQALPDGVKPPPLSRAAWRQTLRSRALMVGVAVTVLSGAGQFVQFSYFAPYYRQKLGLSSGELSLLFMWFGLAGLADNVVMARYVDRVGPPAAVMFTLGLIALSLLVFPLGTSLLLAAVVLTPWALGCFSSNSAQQARLVGIAPALASATVALNSSGIYAGQAIGAAAGGWLILHGGMDWLHWAGLAGVLASMAASALAAGYARRGL